NGRRIVDVAGVSRHEMLLASRLKNIGAPVEGAPIESVRLAASAAPATASATVAAAAPATVSTTASAPVTAASTVTATATAVAGCFQVVLGDAAQFEVRLDLRNVDAAHLVDFHDLDVNLVADIDDVGHFVDVARGQFRDMNHAVAVANEIDEGAE